MKFLKLRALRIAQTSEIPLYTFAIGGQMLSRIASIDPVGRSSDGLLTGFQRGKVSNHIRDIQSYLEEDGALLPNAIVLSVDSSVEFEPLGDQMPSEWGTFGTLIYPLVEQGTEKPAFIVDGQQRTSALAALPPERDFPVVVVAFQSDDLDVRREQFFLVNRSKALPRDLLHELLPHIDTTLPNSLELRKLSATVLESLRYSDESPFFGRIKGVGAEGDEANISQAAVLSVIEMSLKKGGVLASCIPQESEEGEEAGADDQPEPDFERMALYVSVYFQAVRNVWPQAWAGSPWTSRLVHGAGIYGVGSLMDLVMDEVDPSDPEAVSYAESRIAPLSDICAWTEGRWPQLDVAWDELQNTSQDKNRLADYLRSEYLALEGVDIRRDRRDEGEEDDASSDLKREEGFDDFPLADLARVIAEVVRGSGPLSDKDLLNRFAERAGFSVPAQRKKMFNKFVWSAKGMGFISRSGDLWVSGKADLSRDERWGNWTVNQAVDAARKLDDPSTAYEDLLSLLKGSRKGRPTKLMMSVAGTVLNSAKLST